MWILCENFIFQAALQAAQTYVPAESGMQDSKLVIPGPGYIYLYVWFYQRLVKD